MQKIDPDYFITEFDSRRRILHVAYRNRVHPNSREHLEIVFGAFARMLDTYTFDGKIYLIIDMTNFIVEPELKAFYINNARRIIDKYVIPRGIARYGFQITRITVRAGYHQYMTENPNIFNSKEEAYDYIYDLIEKSQSALASSSVMTSGDCEGR